MEPERPSEKVLREYAQGRRMEAEGRFRLHPTDRRLLRDEAVRHYGKAPQSSGGLFQLFALLVRHPAFSASVALLMLALVAWWSLREPNPDLEAKIADRNQAPLRELALSVQTAPAPTEERPASPSAPPADSAPPSAAPTPIAAPIVAPPILARAEVDLKQIEPLGIRADGLPPEVALKKEPPPANPSGLDKAPSAELFRQGKFLFVPANTGAILAQTGPTSSTQGEADDRLSSNAGTALKDSRDTAVNTLASAPAASSEPQPLMDSTLNVSARQNFARSPIVAAKTELGVLAKEKSPSVLNNFELRQNGADIELVDEDGSIYRGKLETSVVTSTAPAALPTRRLGVAGSPATRTFGSTLTPAKSEPTESQTVGIPFQVAGTNKTLNQRVVFNGQLQNQISNQSVASGSLRQGGLTAGRAGALAQGTLQNAISNSKISGRLRVGKEPETELLAVPKAGN